ncbi:MAG: deoxyribodipyrimidine photo-lyase [Chlorobiales bacterium]|nr:deoxyribodipyrimidine photo-lyase [Chlorobiales bacterium]
MIHPDRVRSLNHERSINGPVVYWMSRDQRVRHNWALLFAEQLSRKNSQPLFAVFNLVPSYPEASLRHYDFMLKGLMLVEKKLQALNIPFVILAGNPESELPRFIAKSKAGAIITDFSPLKIAKARKKKVLENTSVLFYEVDTHNIVPCFTASNKLEFSARTIRPKINSRLGTFLSSFPELTPQPAENRTDFKPVDWKRLYNTLRVNSDVEPVSWIDPGEEAAGKALKEFIDGKLNSYAKLWNDPNAHAVSALSPYLHFGQISAQHVAFEVRRSSAEQASKDAFLEELIVRRELAENYCHYNEHYDSLSGIRPWAKETLDRHRNDKRDYLYSPDDLEKASTHDPLWNAAQSELKNRAKMHGYLRMYWAKKILEWTPEPESAFDIALHLNDKYSLDGRDPNGFTGVAWSIGGVHDRPWPERPVFGKIRYMNYNGCVRKFNTDKYIRSQKNPGS